MGDIDYVRKQLFEKDVCLFLCQTYETGWICGDLYWESVYSLPYWDYLLEVDWQDASLTFVRRGCLLLMAALADWLPDATPSDDRLRRFIEPCRATLNAITPTDPREIELREVVIDLFQRVIDGRGGDGETSRRLRQVFDDFVRPYFEQGGGEKSRSQVCRLT